MKILDLKNSNWFFRRSLFLLTTFQLIFLIACKQFGTSTNSVVWHTDMDYFYDCVEMETDSSSFRFSFVFYSHRRKNEVIPLLWDSILDNKNKIVSANGESIWKEKISKHRLQHYSKRKYNYRLLMEDNYGNVTDFASAIRTMRFNKIMYPNFDVPIKTDTINFKENNLAVIRSPNMPIHAAFVTDSSLSVRLHYFYPSNSKTLRLSSDWMPLVHQKGFEIDEN